MTIQFRRDGRTPGPLGIHPTGDSGRAPGPAGTLWQKQTNSPPPNQVKAAAKKTIMPAPTSGSESKDVHVVPWTLFGSRTPAFTEVKQAPGIANCPVASILAALAFTASGRGILQKMVSETAAATVTDLSGVDASSLSNPPPGMKVTSSRYFTVKLPAGAVDVSDVLYTDDHDQGWTPLYMRDPKEQSLWPSIIEKALAVQLEGYENFDALPLTANDYWEKITGAKPGGFKIEKDTPLEKIIEAAKAATRVSSIGASKTEESDVKFVSAFHGHSMLGFEGGKVKLYDPAKAKTLLLSPADFRHDFQAILFAR